MVDLHIHSIYSDGEYSPKQILDLCKERNITTIAITDHNALEGSKRAILDNVYEDITVIPGVELSASYEIKGADLHILGYNMDLENKALNDITQAVMNENITRLKSMLYLLKTNFGFIFKDEDVEKIFQSVGNIGRPDIAKLCIQYGFAASVDDAFDNYLNPIYPNVPKRKNEFTAKSAIECIKNAGGIPCLAHPITLKRNFSELKEYISSLMAFGLEAIEVYHSTHSIKYSSELLKIANDFGLLYSVGSDYHGPVVTPNVELGFGKNNNLNRNSASILSKIFEVK